MRLVQIARVGAPHGIAGWFKVFPFDTDRADFPYTGEILMGRTADGVQALKVEGVRETGKLMLKLVGVDSPEDAARLKGLFIFVPEDRIPPIREKDVYYAYQILGLRVVDENGLELGEIMNIFPAGGNDVYVVRDRTGGETLVPAAKDAIEEIDIVNGLMKVRSAWLS